MILVNIDEILDLFGISDRDIYARETIEEALQSGELSVVESESKYAYVIVDEDGNTECSNCGSGNCFDNYCGHCGAKLIGKQKSESVRHGRWVNPVASDCYSCSVCEEYTHMELPRLLYHYCPNCGAKMDE